MIRFIGTARQRIKNSLLAQRFLGGAGWSAAAAVVGSGLTLIMVMLVARMLGKETYGQFVVIQTTLGTVGVFAGFGIGATATRYAAELRARDPIRLGRILALAERFVIVFSLSASIGLIFAADWLAANMLNAPELGLSLSIAAAAVFFTTLDSYQKSVLIGLESMRAFAIATISGVLLGFPIMLLSASAFGLNGAVLGTVSSGLIQSFISRYQVKRQLSKNSIRQDAQPCLDDWTVLWRFAFPALLAGVVVSPAHWAAQAMLANAPGGYAELAVLGIAMQWFNVIVFLPGTVSRVVLPILTDHFARADQGSSRKILLYAMTSNAIVTVPFAIVIGLASPYIMNLYGANYSNAYLPLVIATTAAALMAIQSPIGNLLAASSRMWLGAFMNFGWSIVYAGVAYLLLDMGATGVAIALLTAYIAHTVWVGWFAVKTLGKS